jgi:cytochrome P450
MVMDLRNERAARGRAPYPPGRHGPSLYVTRGFNSNPLPVLLAAYAEHGPIFTLRVFHQKIVFLLGPEANHFVTVSGADHFTWREGHLGDLIPLLGDGLLTIDGPFHRRSRRIMLPAFHRERIAASLDTIQKEADQAVSRDFHDGARLDLSTWARHLAMRIAMRALFGLDPDGRLARENDAAAQFETALGFWAAAYWQQILRGPRTPWARMQQARARLDAIVYDEINRRRRSGERGADILSLLIDARDEDGTTLDDRHIRDEVMTLLFAGHDTTTSTISFLFHELARNPHERDRVTRELDANVETQPTFAQLTTGELPHLDRAIDETLRLYPAAWIGPRRCAREFTFQGHRVTAGINVNYSSWASHHLPDVWGDPETFRPDRFAPGQRELIPKGAYVPFGGGSRICIGMRFGQLEVKAIAARILRDFTLDLPEDFQLDIRQMPTLSPRHGLPVSARARR